jgi:hypothetical protein
MHQAAGKRMAATKRRIRFRFGFSDAAALKAGATGPSCRGEEHEVLLVWSLTSGKRVVTMDGHEVHFSLGGKFSQNRFETSWPLGRHTIKIIAHAAPSVFKVPGFKQFDLLLDGLSFFDFAKLYELGTKNGIQSNTLVVDRILASSKTGFAKRATLENDVITKNYPALVSQGKPSSLPVRPVVNMPSTEPSALKDFLDSETLDANHPSMPDEFAPKLAAPYTFAVTTNQIKSAYASAPACTPVLALPDESHNHLIQSTTNELVVATPKKHIQASPYVKYDQPPMQQEFLGQPHHHTMQYMQKPQQEIYHFPPQPVVLTMETLSIDDNEDRAQALEMLSPLEKGFRSLVHLDDISVSAPVPRKVQQPKAAKQGLHSQPLPPTNAYWKLGSQARLGEIKQNAAPKAKAKREIMRAPAAFNPTAAQAGMMVVYGPADGGSQMSGIGRHQQYRQYNPTHQQSVGFYPQQQAQRMC